MTRPIATKMHVWKYHFHKYNVNYDNLKSNKWSKKKKKNKNACLCKMNVKL